MKLAVYALLLLQQLHPAHTDTETPEQRTVRMGQDASVVAHAARDHEEVRVLVTLGKFESEFAQYVSEGCLRIPEAASGDCDRGKARSYWQVHRWCKKGWAQKPGSVEAKREFAVCAIQHWRNSRRTCKTDVGAFSAYRMRGCSWRGKPDRGAVARANFLRSLR